jgi:Protein of unknown function (DUF2961)
MRHTAVAVVLAPFLALAIAAPVHAQGAGTPTLELARLQKGVKSKRVSSYDKSGGNNDRLEGIAPGQRRTLFDVKGAGVIDHIWITIAPPPPALSRHDLILRMYWDGEANPSVEAPVGDFFGQGWDESYPFSVLPLAAGPREGRAMVSYFPMPFASGARIEIENDSAQKVDAFYYYVDYQEMASLPADLGRFHAFYNHALTEASPEGENEWSVLGPQGKNTTGDRNYLIADIEGKGHYVGVNYYVDCPSPMWYGEGDDMFFIDGERWPSSLHGTGTEDYFNTSWSPNVLFQHPYFGYARVNGGTGWLGRTHVYRFHLADPVYFDRSLRFSIEHGHDNNLTLDLSSVAYWYQSEPHKAFPAFPSREARKPKPKIGEVDIHLWRDAWRKAHGSGSQLWGNEKEKK